MDNRNEDDGSLGYVAYCAHGGEQWDNLSLSEQMKWEFAALAVADVVRAESQWQPIETAPRDGTRVLLAVPNSLDPKEGFFVSDFGYWEWEYGILDDPTHWRHLLEMPK